MYNFLYCFLCLCFLGCWRALALLRLSDVGNWGTSGPAPKGLGLTRVNSSLGPCPRGLGLVPRYPKLLQQHSNSFRKALYIPKALKQTLNPKPQTPNPEPQTLPKSQHKPQEASEAAPRSGVRRPAPGEVPGAASGSGQVTRGRCTPHTWV